MATSSTPGLDVGKRQQTWLIVGSSRGIGHEFVEQLLARGDRVIATVRDNTNEYFTDHKDSCRVLNCDVTDEGSIYKFAEELEAIRGLQIDHVVLNAGTMRYPNMATEMSFDNFALHLHTNAIGPMICAQRVLQIHVPIRTITFISSDSGSAARFTGIENGFAAYAASKAALNMSLRHMAAELKRKKVETTILALHPGEVKTDMAANTDISWEIDAPILTPRESVESCIKVIESKSLADSGTFWDWENRPYPY